MDSSAETSPTTPSSEDTRRDWLLLILASAGKVGLYLLAAAVLWATIPLLFGLTVTTVASGSMEPGIRTGDVVASLSVEESKLQVGQVLLFDDPAMPGRLKLHRAVEQSIEGITTQGDANPDPDSMLLSPEDVVGVGFVRIPWIGIPVNWLHRGQWVELGGFLAVLGSAALLSNLDRDLRRRDRIARAALFADADSDGSDGPDEDSSREDGASAADSGSAPGSADSGSKPSALVPLLAVLLTVCSTGYLLGGTSASAAFSSSTTASASFGAAEFFKFPWDQASFHWSYSESLLGLNLGTAVDDTPNGRNGSLTGIITRPNENGNPSVYLDGLTAQITSQRTTGAAPNSFTAETWFKTRTTVGGKLMGFGNSQSGASTIHDRQLYMGNTGRLNFGLLQGGQRATISTPGAYNDDRWHLATVTVSETEGSKLYVDGVLVVASATMTQGSLNPNGYWRVGYDSIDTGWPDRPTTQRYSGSLDGTSVYPFPLSPAAVAQHYSYGR